MTSTPFNPHNFIPYTKDYTTYSPTNPNSIVPYQVDASKYASNYSVTFGSDANYRAVTINNDINGTINNDATNNVINDYTQGGTFNDNGTDGKISFSSVTGTFDENGSSNQITISGGSLNSTAINNFILGSSAHSDTVTLDLSGHTHADLSKAGADNIIKIDSGASGDVITLNAGAKIINHNGNQTVISDPTTGDIIFVAQGADPQFALGEGSTPIKLSDLPTGSTTTPSPAPTPTAATPAPTPTAIPAPTPTETPAPKPAESSSKPTIHSGIVGRHVGLQP